MHASKWSFNVILILTVISLTACSTATTSPTPGGFPRGTRTARASTSTVEAASPVPTEVPTTASTPTPAPTDLPTATLDTKLASADCNLAAFAGNITIFDGTKIGPNRPFQKTWQLRNTGACTWNTGYTAIFVSGTRMGGDTAVSIPNDVLPGSFVKISANLYAPPDPGTYTSYWMLKSDSGDLFGVGPNRNQPITVSIVVPQTYH